jgi:aminoglycoside phosphotransferase
MDAAALSGILKRSVSSVKRSPYPYGTSHRLELVDVLLEDGSELQLLLKYLNHSDSGTSSSTIKPPFLLDPQREIQAYRLLASADLGVPVCHAASDDWLLIEKVPGVELWQLGELDAWAQAARWIARLHGHFRRTPPLSSQHLIRYDADYMRLWPERALSREPQVAKMLSRHERAVELLIAQPITFVHGEFYASNVLVAGSRVAPVDWEMAGLGPGVLDIAALATGWEKTKHDVLVNAYGAVPPDALNAARLHLALQWLGWSADWTPPAEHSRDWLAEAFDAAERLSD